MSVDYKSLVRIIHGSKFSHEEKFEAVRGLLSAILPAHQDSYTATQVPTLVRIHYLSSSLDWLVSTVIKEPTPASAKKSKKTSLHLKTHHELRPKIWTLLVDALKHPHVSPQYSLPATLLSSIAKELHQDDALTEHLVLTLAQLLELFLGKFNRSFTYTLEPTVGLVSSGLARLHSTIESQQQQQQQQQQLSFQKLVTAAVKLLVPLLRSNPNPRKTWDAVVPRLLGPLLSAAFGEASGNAELAASCKDALVASVFAEPHVLPIAEAAGRIEWPGLKVSEAASRGVAENGEGGQEGPGLDAGPLPVRHSYATQLFAELQRLVSDVQEDEKTRSTQTLSVVQGLSWLLETYCDALARQRRSAALHAAIGSQALGRKDGASHGRDDDATKQIGELQCKDADFRVFAAICGIIDRRMEASSDHLPDVLRSLASLCACLKTQRIYRPTEDPQGLHADVLAAISSTVMKHCASGFAECECRLAAAQQTTVAAAGLQVVQALLDIEHRVVQEHLQALWPIIWRQMNGSTSSKTDTMVGQGGMQTACSLVETYAELRQVDVLLTSLYDAGRGNKGHHDVMTNAHAMTAHATFITTLHTALAHMPTGQVPKVIDVVASWIPAMFADDPDAYDATTSPENASTRARFGKQICCLSTLLANLGAICLGHLTLDVMTAPAAALAAKRLVEALSKPLLGALIREHGDTNHGKVAGTLESPNASRKPRKKRRREHGEIATSDDRVFTALMWLYTHAASLHTQCCLLHPEIQPLPGHHLTHHDDAHANTIAPQNARLDGYFDALVCDGEHPRHFSRTDISYQTFWKKISHEDTSPWLKLALVKAAVQRIETLWYRKLFAQHACGSGHDGDNDRDNHVDGDDADRVSPAATLEGEKSSSAESDAELLLIATQVVEAIHSLGQSCETGRLSLRDENGALACSFQPLVDSSSWGLSALQSVEALDAVSFFLPMLSPEQSTKLFDGLVSLYRSFPRTIGHVFENVASLRPCLLHRGASYLKDDVLSLTSTETNSPETLQLALDTPRSKKKLKSSSNDTPNRMESSDDKTATSWWPLLNCFQDSYGERAEDVLKDCIVSLARAMDDKDKDTKAASSGDTQRTRLSETKLQKGLDNLCMHAKLLTMVQTKSTRSAESSQTLLAAGLAASALALLVGLQHSWLTVEALHASSAGLQLAETAGQQAKGPKSLVYCTNFAEFLSAVGVGASRCAQVIANGAENHDQNIGGGLMIRIATHVRQLMFLHCSSVLTSPPSSVTTQDAALRWQAMVETAASHSMHADLVHACLEASLEAFRARDSRSSVDVGAYREYTAKGVSSDTVTAIASLVSFANQHLPALAQTVAERSHGEKVAQDIEFEEMEPFCSLAACWARILRMHCLAPTELLSLLPPSMAVASHLAADVATVSSILVNVLGSLPSLPEASAQRMERSCMQLLEYLDAVCLATCRMKPPASPRHFSSILALLLHVLRLLEGFQTERDPKRHTIPFTAAFPAVSGPRKALREAALRALGTLLKGSNSQQLRCVLVFVEGLTLVENDAFRQTYETYRLSVTELALMAVEACGSAPALRTLGHHAERLTKVLTKAILMPRGDAVSTTSGTAKGAGFSDLKDAISHAYASVERAGDGTSRTVVDAAATGEDWRGHSLSTISMLSANFAAATGLRALESILARPKLFELEPRSLARLLQALRQALDPVSGTMSPVLHANCSASLAAMLRHREQSIARMLPLFVAVIRSLLVIIARWELAGDAEGGVPLPQHRTRCASALADLMREFATVKAASMYCAHVVGDYVMLGASPPTPLAMEALRLGSEKLSSSISSVDELKGLGFGGNAPICGEHVLQTLVQGAYAVYGACGPAEVQYLYAVLGGKNGTGLWRAALAELKAGHDRHYKYTGKV